MKTKTVLLRGVEIGAGRPKIIVPIVGKTEQEILDKAAQLVQAKPDVVEWRGTTSRAWATSSGWWIPPDS